MNQLYGELVIEYRNISCELWPSLFLFCFFFISAVISWWATSFMGWEFQRESSFISYASLTKWHNLWASKLTALFFFFSVLREKKNSFRGISVDTLWWNAKKLKKKKTSCFHHGWFVREFHRRSPPPPNKQMRFSHLRTKTAAPIFFFLNK